MKHSTFDKQEIMSLLFNNEQVYIELPFNDHSGMMISRTISHFHGYKKQPNIEVRFYEKDGNYMSYATEYFNVYNIENATDAVLSRYYSEDPLVYSKYSTDFESTFVKE
ncbi:hypothetical protein ENKO_469 [Klebsiella phage fENko-Kae01]|nr:hypothetical protein [Salmonella enterica]WNV47572.1 hypothetical protein [Klebsiella phage fENko-Kae01]